MVVHSLICYHSVITLLLGSFLLPLLLLLLPLFPMYICNAILRHLQVNLVFAYPLLSCLTNCQQTDVSKVTYDLLLCRHHADVQNCLEQHPGPVKACCVGMYVI